MKITLLGMTQDILSSLDSDEVNSISDTPESIQVANLIKTVYNDIVSRANLPEHFDLFELNASGDNTKPTIMFRPSGLQNLLWVKYDKRLDGETNSNYQKVDFVEPMSFIERFMSYRDQNQNNVITFSVSTPNTSFMEIKCLNNKAPDYWTCWDDKIVVFDSYDNTVDSTLMKSKTMVYGEYEPSFSMEDSFIPDLDSRQFSLLFNEAKALAFSELKQVDHPKAEKNAKRGWVTLAHQKNEIPTNPPFFNTLPHYGRKK